MLNANTFTLDWNSLFVTGLSVLSAVIVGIITSATARSTARKEREVSMKTAVLDKYLAVRLDAFKSVLDALTAISKTRDKDAFSEVYGAISTALLLAGPETGFALLELQEELHRLETADLSFDMEGYQHKLAAAISALHDDLLNYSEPLINLRSK